MKKLSIILVIGLLALAVSMPASAVEVEISGVLDVQYIDAQKDAATEDGAFYLGSQADEMSLDHSFILLKGVVNEDISVTYKQNISTEFAGINALPSTREEAYLTIKNLKGLPEGTTLRAGQFYVPFGLGVWDANKNMVADDPVIADDPRSTTDFGDYSLDRGLELSGSQSEINYKVAYVMGAQDNAKDLWVKLGSIYKDVPCGLSYFRGKADAGVNKFSATGLDAAYKPNPKSSLEGEYIWSKRGIAKTNYSYLKATYKIDEANTAFLKYYEVDPKGEKTAKAYQMGNEYQYAKNTTLKIEYVVNDGKVGTTDPDNNLIKAEIKVSF